MASLTDVENAIVTKIAASKPSGYTVYYFPGFPFPEMIQTQMAASRVLVNVFPQATTKRLGKYLNDVPLQINDTTVFTEKSRQLRWFQIEVLAYSPQSREAVGEALKVALDAIDFLTFADTSGGRIQYVNENEDDSQQKENVYRRVYIYSVEYATMLTETVVEACHPQILNVDDAVISESSEASVLVDEIT